MFIEQMSIKKNNDRLIKNGRNVAHFDQIINLIKIIKLIKNVRKRKHL